MVVSSWRWPGAWRVSAAFIGDSQRRTRILEQALIQLREQLNRDPLWPAIAAVADELLAHESLENDQIADILGFWIG